jgi:hypothetical protein
MVLTTNEGMECWTICLRFETHFKDFDAWPSVSMIDFLQHNKHVGFGDKQHHILHKFLLLCIIFLIQITIPKMICDGPITNDRFLFGLFLV